MSNWIIATKKEEIEVTEVEKNEYLRLVNDAHLPEAVKAKLVDKETIWELPPRK